MAEFGVILNPCRASLAAADWISFSNSTKAISWRPGTRRTSLKPGNCNSNCISCWGWLFLYFQHNQGGASKTGAPAGAGAGTGTPIALEGGTLAGTTPSVAFFFFFLASSGPAPMRFGLSWKVPFSLAITSESDLERRRRLLLNGVWIRAGQLRKALPYKHHNP